MCQIHGAEAEIDVSEVPRYRIGAGIAGYRFAAVFWNEIIGPFKLAGYFGEVYAICDCEHGVQDNTTKQLEQQSDIYGLAHT